MRVAIGAVAGTRGGPATYAIELVRALAREFPGDDWTVMSDAPDAFAGIAEAIHVPLRSPWRQPLWDHFGVARALGRGRFDLYHGTKGVLPRVTRVPSVVTLHDLAVRVMPETFSRAQRLHLRLETAPALRRARVVITVSRSAANDVRRLYPKAAAKLVIIPHGVPEGLKPATPGEVARWRARHDLDDAPLVGFLGTLQPRKNIDLLAEAFARAAGRRPWRLVLAGRLRPGYRPAALDSTDARIRYVGEIAPEELPAYFGALSCMVSPSAYEGFGLTFLEAMASGCPVIGMANSSIPEVVGDAGLLLRTLDVARLADAIETVVTDVGLAADLSRRGTERAALFSWRETARQTRLAYERALTRDERAADGGR